MTILLAILFAVVISAPAHGQTSPPASPSATPQRSVRCSSPANPRKLYFECPGREFDFIEDTLTQDWLGFRSELNKLGITPTASYTTQLMGNPSGGQSRGFTYSGTLQTAIFWDLDKLIGVPGLSFNIDVGWSTGKNLSADYVGNLFAVQSAYTAPGNGTNNLTLGVLYLQQQLFNNSLMIAAGRLTPQSTFATMPVLNQYINGGINPVPGHLSINDATFTAYPPGVEWGAQAIYNITPTVSGRRRCVQHQSKLRRWRQGRTRLFFQQGNRGALSMMQVNYLVNHAPETRVYRRQYSFGGFYDGNKFTSLSNPNAD